MGFDGLHDLVERQRIRELDRNTLARAASTAGGGVAGVCDDYRCLLRKDENVGGDHGRLVDVGRRRCIDAVRGEGTGEIDLHSGTGTTREAVRAEHCPRVDSGRSSRRHDYMRPLLCLADRRLVNAGRDIVIAGVAVDFDVADAVVGPGCSERNAGSDLRAGGDERCRRARERIDV